VNCCYFDVPRTTTCNHHSKSIHSDSDNWQSDRGGEGILCVTKNMDQEKGFLDILILKDLLRYFGRETCFETGDSKPPTLGHSFANGHFPSIGNHFNMR
jgi:hypothetical protein